MSLLLLGSSSDPNVRSLFSNNELGLAIDIGDRNGASEAKRTWRRNVVTYSEQFSNAAWTKLNVTVTENTQVAPDGTTTADTLTDDATAGLHYIQHSLFSTNSTAQRFCRSFYVKKGTARYIAISPISNFNASINVMLFDLDTGLYVNTPDPVYIDGYAVENAGNGWWRISYWSDQAGAGYGRVNLAIYNSNNPANGSYSGTGDTVYIWGFQAEYDVTSPTTYQPITDWNTEFKAAYPTHSLYVDSNGVAPAVYPGDQVGLVIDSSRGGLENLGAELVTVQANRDFSSDTGYWTKQNGTITISGGVVNFSSTGDLVALYAATSNLGTPSGKFYLVEFEIKSISAGGIRFGIGGEYTPSSTTTGVKRFILRAGTFGFFGLYAVGTTTATVDNISVKEIPGIHPYQTTSGSRPALCRTPDGGRRNLLVRTEEMVEGVAWTNAGTTSTVTQNAIANPLDGQVTADNVNITDVSSSRFQQTALTISASTQYTISAYFKNNTMTTGQTFDFRISNFLAGPNDLIAAARVNLFDGSVTNVSGGSGVSGTSVAIVALANGWYRVSVTFTSGAGAATTLGGIQLIRSSNAANFYAFGFQYELGSSATTYQRVGLASDVTESGKRDCWGLLADGSDDSLITSSVDFTGATTDTRRNVVSASEHWGTPWSQWITSATYGEAGPEGRNNAATFVNVVGSGGANLAQVVSYVPSQPYVLTFWVKAGTSPNGNFGMFSTASGTFINGTATILSGPGSVFGTALMQLSGLTSSWTKVQLTFTSPATNNLNLFYYVETSGSRTGLSNTLAQFQIEPGSTPTAYQPTGTDKMTVMAGVRKNSDAAAMNVVESSTAFTAADGSFAMRAANSGADYYYGNRGSTAAQAVSSLFAAPTTNVVTGVGDIAGDETRLRVDGVSRSLTTSNLGSGNFGNHVIYLLRRAGTSNPFSGILYTLIIRGAVTPTATIENFEKNLLRIRAGLGPF